MIYLDYAANTPVREEVLAVFCETSRQFPANPNASHRLGVLARERLDECSAELLRLLGAPDYEAVYTSGASESNNLAIKGAAEKYRARGRHIIVSCMEHSSVNGAAAALQNAGFEVEYAPADQNGLVDLPQLRELLRPDTILVSCCLVDSEVGTRQPVEEIAKLLTDYPNCLFHVDATQAVGKIPVPVGAADLLSFAPHKFYGLNGSGVLLKRKSVLLEPLIHGGISTTPYRSGTPALALAAATEKALELALAELDENYRRVQSLNKRLRAALKRFSRVKINSADACVPFILNFSLPGVSPQLLLAELEERDIFLSSKSACCAPNTVSRPVYAMTKDRRRSMSTLRVSLSHLTTEDELEQFLVGFSDCYEKFVR